MRIVSVLTTDELGGAEFAAVDWLDGLATRGHDVLLLTNHPEVGAKTAIRTAPIDLGPKLRRATALRTTLMAPRSRKRMKRAIASDTDAVLLHFKKEQLLSPLVRPDRAAVVWAEW